MSTLMKSDWDKIWTRTRLGSSMGLNYEEKERVCDQTRARTQPGTDQDWTGIASGLDQD